MEAIEELLQLSEWIRQGQAFLAAEDVDDISTASTRRSSTFFNVVALGNVGAGKSAVLNSLIGHPVLPTGENGATRAPISIDLQRDSSLSSKSIILQIENRCQQVSARALRYSLLNRLSESSSGRSRDEIYLKLRTSTAPPLKLIDLPGLDQQSVDESMLGEYAKHNDAILLVIIPASQVPEVASSKALSAVKEYDGAGTRTIGVISKIDQAASDQKALAAVQALLSNQGPSRASDIPWVAVIGTRTVGVISKIDQAASDQKALAAVQALLLNQGPLRASDIPWVALIGQSVPIASAQSGSENSLENAWRAEIESLKSILTGAPQSKLGRIALVDALAQKICSCMKFRLPNLFSGLQWKSQMVHDELVMFGASMVQSAEGTRSLALELCREFENQFLLHITSSEGYGWKIVSSFEGNFRNRIKQLPLDRHFDINNVKRILLEADGYQPYLIPPEKGLGSLMKGVLELAKESSCLYVAEVHRVLVDMVSAAANATPGLGRYPSFKREVVAIATGALDVFKIDAKKMVVAHTERAFAFVPSPLSHFVQSWMERQHSEEEAKTRSSKKGQEAAQSIMNRSSSPQTCSQESGATLKSLKDKFRKEEKEVPEASGLKTAGLKGEITGGFLYKKSPKRNKWKERWFILNEEIGKLGYAKKREERQLRGAITLEKCNIEEIEDEEPASSKSSKDKKVNGPAKSPSLAFKLTSNVPYAILKEHRSVVLKAETVADKVEWIKKISKFTQPTKGALRGAPTEGGGPTMQQSLADGSLDTMTRTPANTEEDLRWMSQEVRDYVKAVLNSLAASVPKAVLCQVEKAKEDMLNQLYSSISGQSTTRIEELVTEDDNGQSTARVEELPMEDDIGQSTARVEELPMEDDIGQSTARVEELPMEDDIGQSTARIEGLPKEDICRSLPFIEGLPKEDICRSLPFIEELLMYNWPG